MELRIITFLSLINCVNAALKPSGFYFDNGNDQTAVDLLDIEDQELMREEILNLLGLSRVPKKNLNPKVKNLSVPVFMTNIYTSLTENGDEGTLKSLVDDDEIQHLLANPFNISENNIKAINSSDIIMSFINRDLQEESQWTPLFWFDTSELPDTIDTEILNAELRIYKEAVPALNGKSAFHLKVYQMKDESLEDPKLLDTQTIEYGTSGWLVLNVSQALQQWQLEQETNQGIMIEVTEVATSNQVHPVALGLVTGKQTTVDKESFMVTYLRSTGDMVRQRYNRRFKRKLSTYDVTENSYDVTTEEDRERQERDLKIRKRVKTRNGNKNQSRKPNLHLRDIFKFGSSKNNRNLFGKRDPIVGHCQKRMLRVEFKDLNWQDWIISPNGYDKYYCKGDCIFPLSSNTHPTSHAILQALAHSMDPDLIPMPCCAATKLSGLSVLYFDEASNVVLKKYKNMVVKNCGCQ